MFDLILYVRIFCASFHQHAIGLLNFPIRQLLLIAPVSSISLANIEVSLNELMYSLQFSSGVPASKHRGAGVVRSYGCKRTGASASVGVALHTEHVSGKTRHAAGELSQHCITFTTGGREDKSFDACLINQDTFHVFAGYLRIGRKLANMSRKLNRMYTRRAHEVSSRSDHLARQRCSRKGRLRRR